jgi:hypothetical protein
MNDTDKLSRGQAAIYLGLPEETIDSLYKSGFLPSCDQIGSSIPVFLRGELRKFRSLRSVPVDPMQEAIRTRRETIDAARQLAQQQMTDLQAECKHPNAVKVNNSDTGNWDRGQDRYWRDCKCPDCGKVWQEDQ